MTDNIIPTSKNTTNNNTNQTLSANTTNYGNNIINKICKIKYPCSTTSSTTTSITVDNNAPITGYKSTKNCTKALECINNYKISHLSPITTRFVHSKDSLIDIAKTHNMSLLDSRSVSWISSKAEVIPGNILVFIVQ
jgi:hypothetical protein